MITYKLKAQGEVSIGSDRKERTIVLFATNEEGRRVTVEITPGEAVTIGTSLVSVGRGLR